MQSAQRIDFVSHDAVNVANMGGQSSRLTVTFRVHAQGPAHVAGIVYTSDFWATPVEARAAFQHFDGGDEVWQITVSVPGNDASFEYAIFCDDYRGMNSVPRIWNNANGETFKIAATHF